MKKLTFFTTAILLATQTPFAHAMDTYAGGAYNGGAYTGGEAVEEVVPMNSPRTTMRIEDALGQAQTRAEYGFLAEGVEQSKEPTSDFERELFRNAAERLLNELEIVRDKFSETQLNPFADRISQLEKLAESFKEKASFGQIQTTSASDYAGGDYAGGPVSY